ncbi:MAG: hypothetical protein Q9157_004573 [Trypethelium eluteriae]
MPALRRSSLIGRRTHCVQVLLETQPLPKSTSPQSGLVKYYKDWNSREEDVEVAVTSLEREQNILILLQRSLKMENHSALLIDDIAEVEKCIVNIQRAFSCLDTILQKCRHYPAPGSMKERAKTIGVVALYPFRKDTLKEIQHRVGDIGIVLAKAVQILQL